MGSEATVLSLAEAYGPTVGAMRLRAIREEGALVIHHSKTRRDGTSQEVLKYSDVESLPVTQVQSREAPNMTATVLFEAGTDVRIRTVSGTEQSATVAAQLIGEGYNLINTGMPEKVIVAAKRPQPSPAPLQ